MSDDPKAPQAVTGLASAPVVLVSEQPAPMPSKISDQIGRDSHASTKSRVAIWLAETKYFLSTLQHEVAGEHGKLLADLKAKL